MRTIVFALVALLVIGCEQPTTGEAVQALGSGGASSCECTFGDPDALDPFCPAACPTVGVATYAGATASAQFCACGWSAYVCDDTANGGHCTMPQDCFAARGPQVDGGSNGVAPTCGNATAWCCPLAP